MIVSTDPGLFIEYDADAHIGGRGSLEVMLYTAVLTGFEVVVTHMFCRHVSAVEQAIAMQCLSSPTYSLLHQHVRLFECVLQLPCGLEC